MSVSLIWNGLNQGEGLLPLLFSVVLEYAIRRVQINQDVVKINRILQLLVYADDVNIMGGRVRTIKKNTQSLVSESTAFRQEVNGDKTKYMVTSRDMNAGRSHNIKIHYSSVERVEESNIL
jgi:hypothetical protein